MDETNSILISIKKLLGIDKSYTHFDADLIMHINSALFVLTQLGVGDPDGFSIKDEEAQWRDFVSDYEIESVKSYVFMKVKLLFDPPTSSSVIESYNRLINEFEWRITVAVDSFNSRE